MQEQFDKRLADKIRKEMKDYEPSFNPAHWTDMQKRMGRGVSNTPRMIFTLFSILLLAGVAYLPLGNATFERDVNFVLTDSLAENYLSDNPQITEETASLFTQQENNVNIIVEEENTIQNNPILAEDDLISQNVKKDQTNALLNEEQIGSALRGNLNAPQLTESNEEGENDVINTLKDRNIQNNVSTQLGQNDKEGIDFGNQKSNFEDNNIAIQINKLSLTPKNLVIDSLQIDTELIKYDWNAKKDVLSLSKFSMSIVAEGFMNQNNRIDNYRKPGFGVGALVNFMPNNKMTISTGLIVERLSSKAFPDQSDFEEADNSVNLEAIPTFSAFSLNDYAANSQELTELVTITGNFTAVEIPLQFSYYLSRNRSRRIYISGAASSYFYLSEKYNFEKEEFQIPARSNTRKLSIVNEEITYGAFEKFDLFSSFTLSAGLEKKVGIQSSVAIEPFFRFPMRKMGVERMPINSTGIRVKYNFGW